MEYKELFLGWRNEDGTYQQEPPPEWMDSLREAIKATFNLVETK